MARRGFIFSLDAFVAFSISLIAIYSLIFFSSVPSGYYQSLTQAHFLAKDSLYSLANTPCTGTLCGPQDEWRETEGISVLEFFSLRHTVDNSERIADSVRSTFGRIIPTSYGYSLEVYDRNDPNAQADGWVSIYSTSTDASDENHHKRQKTRLSTVVYSVVFNYAAPKPSLENPAIYMSCGGIGNSANRETDYGNLVCLTPTFDENGNLIYPDLENPYDTNFFDRQDGRGRSDVRVVRLTVFL